MKVDSLPLSPFAARVRLSIYRKGLNIEIVSPPEGGIKGDAWAVGGQPSIADCALVPVLNAVSLVESVYDQPDLIGKYKKLGAYWQAAKADEINAKVIAEQLAAVPKA